MHHIPNKHLKNVKENLLQHGTLMDVIKYSTYYFLVT